MAAFDQTPGEEGNCRSELWLHGVKEEGPIGCDLDPGHPGQHMAWDDQASIGAEGVESPFDDVLVQFVWPADPPPAVLERLKQRGPSDG